MRSLVALIGTTGLVLGLAACGGSTEQPAGQQGQPAAPAGVGPNEQGKAASPEQELAGVGSTLDAIDSELASDGSP
jgi:hypothetical protein